MQSDSLYKIVRIVSELCECLAPQNYKLCKKHTHFFIQVLESFEHEPAKKLKRFIFTLVEENVTYEQLKLHLKLE